MGRNTEDPPDVNLKTEKINGEIVKKLINDQLLSSCHDISDGGLIISICELLIKSNIGANIKIAHNGDILEELFAEDQSRYIISVSSSNQSQMCEILNNASTQYHHIGNITGTQLKVNDKIVISLSELTEAFENLIPELMAS
jgi:phosphoribosylformylglycinamidine synthase